MPLDKSSPNPTCFATALHIGNTDIADAKDFTIIVENEKGRVEKIISLEVLYSSCKFTHAVLFTHASLSL